MIPQADAFASVLRQHGLAPLRRASVGTFQVNVGKRCNQACHHCHVDAGPRRTEMMSHEVAARVIALLDRNPEVSVVDITGGAPELNPHFRWLVTEGGRRGRRVIDRCNLTIVLEDGQEDLGEFLAAHDVEIVASLPCYTADNVDRQRGRGVFERSITALRRLNALGYGRSDSALRLDLVYNPLGAVLPAPQEALERRYRAELAAGFGVEFHRLLTLTNMPINRFAEMLARDGRSEEYMSLLVNHFNPATVPALMCRHLVSIGWDGRLYDCDFNQMLEMPLRDGPATVWDLDRVGTLAGRAIATAPHCLGCTAGAGSSCGGALA